jgi:hypothetical protein
MDADVVLFRYKTTDDAVVRLTSLPLVRGLNELGIKAKDVHVVNSQTFEPSVVPRKIFIFHYDDPVGARSAKYIKTKYASCKIVCIGCDLYKLNVYRNLDSLVDCFLMPTIQHKQILEPAVSKNVFVVPEGIDTLSLPENEFLSCSSNNKVCWFGYAESFEKSMCYLKDCISDAIRLHGVKFSIITKSSIPLMDAVEHINFDVAEFYIDTSAFSYSILSHFVYDGHINTYIKSPNKLITSIVRGLVPIVSNTPNYRHILDKYGLTNLSFSSGDELSKMMGDLDCLRDRTMYSLDRVREDLINEYSPKNIALKFIDAGI